MSEEEGPSPRVFQTGAINMIVVLNLHDETPEGYDKASAVLASYGFRRSVDKDENVATDLPSHVWVASRVDLLDTFRYAVLEKLRDEGVQVKAFFVGSLAGYAMMGQSDW